MDFLKQNKLFSFNYNGKSIWEYDYEMEVTESGSTIITTYLFDGCLQVTNTAKKYGDFGVYEWVNRFKNTGNRPTGIITDLYDCSCGFNIGVCKKRPWTAWLPDPMSDTLVYAQQGSDCSAYEFSCNVEKYEENMYQNVICAGEKKHYQNSGGRSSDGCAPFFNIHYRGNGIIAAIGWSGQWNCDIERTESEVIIKSKIQDTAFYIEPGESFRTSSILLMPYEGSVIDSQNKWRRFIKKHIGVIGENETMPFCASVWGGMTSEQAIERIELIKDNGLPFEYIWMDAGWYGTSTQDSPDGFEGDWWENTGDWRVNTYIHPDEMLDVRKKIDEAGKKFILWFEPERVIIKAPVCKEHPEYLLSNGDDDNIARLLNLGREDVLEYCYRTISDKIKKLRINCYRQDFNTEVLKYWQSNDGENRCGITEIKYINGLYRLWDMLLEEFPDLLIDNCSSGGRRIDIEMMKRSIPLWRSDAQCSANYIPEIVQSNNIAYSLWIPYSGTGTGREYDEYRIRSSYAGGLTTDLLSSARDSLKEINVEWMKKYCNEYLMLRPYFYGDVYPLTKISDNDDIWSAVQFDRPEYGDGIVQVFKRKNAPYTQAQFTLGGIKADKKYIFTDIDGGEFSVSGDTLISEGLNISINEKRKAKIYMYRSIG